MKRRAWLRALPVLFAPLGPVRAQSASPPSPIEYPAVRAGSTLAFPRDHGSHPEYRIEWWYVTGWLRDRGGNELGVQVTFFRNRPAIAHAPGSAFAPRQVLFAHAALAMPAKRRLLHDERVARAVFDLAGASETDTRVWIGDWRFSREDGRYTAAIDARGFGLALVFAPTQPLLLQGEAGVSRKGPLESQASHYYSVPQLAVSGEVRIDGATSKVEGRAWLDHEWSSQYLPDRAVGWDWIGINLDDGGALMAFRMRDARGEAMWAAGTLRDAQGASRRFGPDDVRFEAQRWWTSPRTGFRYPVAFAVTLGGVGYEVVPLLDDAELDSRASTGTVYWEGPVELRSQTRRLGRGYLELTGYGTLPRI